MKKNLTFLRNTVLSLGLSLMASMTAFAAEEDVEFEEVKFTSELNESATLPKKNSELEEAILDSAQEALETVSDDGFTSSLEPAGDETEEFVDDQYEGPVLTPFNGTIMGPSGKETYYNLDMSGVVSIMRGMGNEDEYWVREDGVKMLGDYIMCAANLDVHPRGSYVQSSLGMCIVCDTGGFAYENPYQLDIAVTW